jgi:23S rRNA pseudouridine955/2504/2580 synthase
MGKKALRPEIVYEDDHLLGIHKPAGWLSIEGRGTQLPSIIQWVRKNYPEATPCHRIDKDTSGLILVAKNLAVYTEINQLFEKREVQKIYHAVVEGQHDFEQLEVDLPLKTTRRGFAAVNYKIGKTSNTTFSTLKKFKHYSLIECKPHTGRLHQIRIHLSHLGAPITGDVQYGGQLPYLSAIKKKYVSKAEIAEDPMISRFSLHAYSISLVTSWAGQIDIKCPYSKDLEVFIKILTKYDL